MIKKVINIPRRFVKGEWGGTETVILETSRQLMRMGVDASIYTSLALSDQSREDVSGVQVRRFPYTYTRLRLSRAAKVLLDKRGGDMYSGGLLRALLSATDTDLVHLHTAGRMGAMGRRAARTRGIPYVVSVHGGILDIPAQQMAEIVAPAKGTLNWGKPIDLLMQRNRVLSDADAIVCVGERERERLSEQFPGKRVVFLPNGVDEAKFASASGETFRQAFSIPEDSRIVLSVGGYYSQKNQEALIQAFARVAKQNPELRLVLIGVIYDRRYHERLCRKVRELAIEERTLMLADIRFDDPILADAYAAADLFVLPSLYETFGIVILEAWAAGVPTICGAVGGIPSFVADGSNGLFCDVRSPDDMADKMKVVIDNDRLCQRIRSGASKSVKQYTWRSITRKLLDVYEELA